MLQRVQNTPKRKEGKRGKPKRLDNKQISTAKHGSFQSQRTSCSTPSGVKKRCVMPVQSEVDG